MDIKAEEAEIKKEFQLERVILFTDAVFAIILTIMVLDVRLPASGDRHIERQVLAGFDDLVPKLLAYMITFTIVARFWMIHLRLFRYLKDYDTTLISLNLLFLFCTSLFPFAVSLIYGSISPKLPEYSWGWGIYITVFCLTTFVQTLICKYLLKKKDILCIDTPNLEATFRWKVQRLNFVLVPLIIVAVFVFIYRQLPFVYIQFTMAIYGFITARLLRKYYPKGDGNAPLIARAFRSIKRRKTESPASAIEQTIAGKL